MSDDPDTFAAAGLDEADVETLYGPIDEMLVAAFEHARCGRPVVPLWWPVWAQDGTVRCACGLATCDNIGKHPITEHGFKDATTDRATITTWWRTHPRANIGIPTGTATFDVVDIDPDKGGDTTLARLERQHGALPETAETLTGGGGRHLMFRSAGLRCSTDKLGDGVDTRGSGGYIVAPPSVHKTSRRYEPEVLHALDEFAMASLPAWILARVNGTDDDGHNAPATPVEDVIPEGQRNSRLASLAGSMRRRGMTETAIRAALLVTNQERCRPPLGESEVRAIAKSVGRYEPDAGTADAQAETAAAGDARTPETDDAAGPKVPVADWPLYDGAEPWEFPAITELIEALLPSVGIVWWGGLPKRYKSLLALYCALALACRRSSVAKKFLVRAFPKILYVAREDGGARLQDRRDDILSAWTERPEPGAIIFVIRPRLDLLNPEHIAWLRETCIRLGITMVVLDTWTALSPSADPLGTRDQAQLAALVVRLCEDIGGLVVVVDHSRKNRPEGQPLSSADIFGPPQKWAAAEHIVMLDVVEAGRRIEIFVEGKDMETRRFFLTVSPRGSGEEKFAFAGSVEDLAEAQHAVGDRNRQAVLDAVRSTDDSLSTGEIVAHLAKRKPPLTLSQDTVSRHCEHLVGTGDMGSTGTGKNTRYFALNVTPQGPSAANEPSP